MVLLALKTKPGHDAGLLSFLSFALQLNPYKPLNACVCVVFARHGHDVQEFSFDGKLGVFLLVSLLHSFPSFLLYLHASSEKKKRWDESVKV